MNTQETHDQRLARISAMSRRDLIDYIFDLENRVWPGCGHLGAMWERERENLIAVAMMYHQIEDEAAARQALQSTEQQG